MRARADIIDNSLWNKARRRLSVLIPNYRHDPTPLLLALNNTGAPVEVVVLDDGSHDRRLARRIGKVVRGMALPARLIRLRANEGRAKARNRLAAAARARHLLFLDADMLPDEDDFLDQWLNLADDEDPAVAFGGFTLRQAPQSPALAVHRTMAQRSDCLPVEARRLAPEKYVFTSNLLIRRDVFEEIPFDQAFAGWGWEDVEWAMRVSRRYEILHVDIPATHLGLDPAPVMAAKYEQSTVNFARVASAHPDIVRRYPSYRAARLLKRAPLLRLWRPLLKAAALTEMAPVTFRAFALRLYRAALYAEAV